MRYSPVGEAARGGHGARIAERHQRRTVAAEGLQFLLTLRVFGGRAS
jgi:hypothetical protein